jgi:hypothetical protein
MKIEDQVLSVEQVRELQELGFDVKKHSSIKSNGKKVIAEDDFYIGGAPLFPTMTIGDIINVLPETIITEYCGRYIRSHIEINKKVVCYPCYDKNGEVSIMLFHSMQEILIDSLFDCVVWCIKEKHIKI